MNKCISVNANKTLRLTNILQIEATQTSPEGVEQAILQMENYLKVNHAFSIGPVIQQTELLFTEGRHQLKILLMQQADIFIENPEPPYTMLPLYRAENCLYARFQGKKENLHFAYDKLYLLAYEENISLLGICTTIFVHEDNEDATVDIFMERVKDETE